MSLKLRRFASSLPPEGAVTAWGGPGAVTSSSFAALPKLAASLPGATEDIKWGEDRVFSVGAKMFVVFYPAKGTPTQCSFKVDDERFLELTGLPNIEPAPYLARAHWVQFKSGHPLSLSEMQVLLRRAHALTAAKLTKKLQKELGIAPP